MSGTRCRNTYPLSILLCLPVVMFLFLSACQSQEEKDKVIVEAFVQALEVQNTDEIIPLRKKIIERGADIVRILVESMPNASGSTKSELTYLIEKMGDQAIEPISSILFSDTTDQKKSEALNLLGQLKNPKATKQLEAFLEISQDNLQLRYETAKILVQLKNDTGFLVLNDLLFSGNRSQQISIAILYSELADSRSLPGLIAALEQDPDGELKTYIIETLGKLKNNAVLPLIQKYGLMDEKSYLVRRTAAVAITTITGKKTQYIDNDGQKKYP